MPEWLEIDCKCGLPLYHEAHDDNNLMGHKYDPDTERKVKKNEHAIYDDEYRNPFAEFDLGFLQ